MKRFIAIFMILSLVLGMSSMSVWADDEATWQEETSLPSEYAPTGVCSVGNKIYLIGGASGRAYYLKNVNIYNTETRSWSTGTPMPVDKDEFTVSAIGNKIYVMGGKYESTAAKSVQIYDIQTDTWSTGANMITAIYGARSVSIDNKIYVMGGRINTVPINGVSIYDAQTNTWTAGASMPTPNSEFSVESYNNKIYVIGGNTGGSALASMEIYDPQTNKWTNGVSMSEYKDLHTSCIIGDKIYVIGGRHNSNLLNTVEIFNCTKKSWTKGKSFITPRTYPKACAVGDKIYMIGGLANGAKLTTSIESLKVGGAFDDSSTKISVLLNEGESVQLSTSFNLDNNKNYTWSSTNEAVATVDANGKVTAVAEGTADIYAQNADGTFKEYIPVKVVKGIADELRLAVHLKTGEKAKLYLTDDPSKVTWTSMDESIATVAADGQVTGVKKGLAIVKAELDGQAYQIYVRVNG